MERNRSLDIRTQPNVGVTPRAGSVPNGFLFPDGGTFDFFGTKSRLYNTLPTKGNSLPRFRKQHESIEQPANFTGSVGHVVPKPTSWILLGIGSFDCGWLMPEPRGVIDLSLKVLSASNCYFVASSGMFTG